MKTFNAFMTEAYVAQDKSIQEGWKAVAKRLPGVRTVLGLGSAAYRASKGDWTGAALSAGSAIPGPIGWGFVGADIARDLAGGGNKKPEKPKSEAPKPETAQAVTPADTKPATPADTKPPSAVGAGAATGAAAAVAKGAKRIGSKNIVGGGTRSAAMSKAASQAGTQKALTAIGRKYITK